MALPVPLPTKIFVIAAGVFQMPVGRFAAATVAGRSLRYFGEAGLALRYREGTMTFIQQNVWMAVGVGLGLTLVFIAVNRYATRRVRAGV